MFVHVEILCARRTVNAQFRQHSIDVGLRAPLRRKTGQRASKVLASLRVEVAEEVAEANGIAHPAALFRIWSDENDGRRNLWSRPECRRRHASSQRFHI